MSTVTICDMCKKQMSFATARMKLIWCEQQRIGEPEMVEKPMDICSKCGEEIFRYVGGRKILGEAPRAKGKPELSPYDLRVIEAG